MSKPSTKTALARAAGVAFLTLLTIGGCSCDDDAPAPAATCAQLTCAEHQLCQEASGSAPAACATACETGFAWSGTACVASATATCEALPAAGSIALRCEMDHRTCAETTPGAATCTTCLEGFVNVGGTCEEMHTCSELMCSTQNRSCNPAPNGHCTECLDGFIEDGASCRAPKTCADITCGSNETCFAMPGADAVCRAGNCPAGQAPRASGGGCVVCTVNCAGRPGGTGRVYTEVATLADTCVCETEDGYFWDEGAFGGGDIRACDADADGWTRTTARRALERAGDLAVRTNARCSIRSIDRVLLIDDQGSRRQVTLATPVNLYEPERLDDAALLQDAIDQGTLPPYDGRPLQANELNTLTKACVWKATAQQQADFNQNGLEDIDEAHEDPRLQNPTDPLTPLYDFTYFIELDRGWYEAATAPGGRGRYVIAEKHRAANEADLGWKLALTPAAEDGTDKWRTCERQRDGEYEPAKSGFDFAELDDPATWAGMGHHSQFRCVRVVANPTIAANEATPEEIAVEWRLNRCTAGASAPPIGTSTVSNPSDPILTCAVATVPDPRTSLTAPVLLAVSKYVRYDDQFSTVGQPTYVRGCINECAVHPDFCPGYSFDPALSGAQCVGDRTGYGTLFCGCGYGFAGAGCEVACPGDLARANSDGVGHLFTGALELAPRSGDWLCGSPTNGSGTLTGQVAGSTVTWSLHGEVPPGTTPTTELCAPADGGVPGADGGCEWRIHAGAP